MIADHFGSQFEHGQGTCHYQWWGKTIQHYIFQKDEEVGCKTDIRKKDHSWREEIAAHIIQYRKGERMVLLFQNCQET